MRSEDEAALAKCRLMSALSADVRARLLRAGIVKTLAPGSVLWKSGEPAEFVFVILSGRAGIFDTLVPDRSTVIDLFEPGDVITGAATLADAPNLFSGKAIGELRVLAIPMTIYRAELDRDLRLMRATALCLVDGWRRLMLQVRNLKQLSANQRLGSYLLTLTPRRNGSASVRLADDQQLIAAILGVTRESLSRSFAQLRAHGVSKRGRTVTITELSRLRSFCEKSR